MSARNKLRNGEARWWSIWRNSNAVGTIQPRTKKFHVADILSVLTGKRISPQGLGGVYDLLGFLTTGKNPYSNQIPRLCTECAPYLWSQLPMLDQPPIRTFAIGEYLEMLQGLTSPDAKRLTIGWLSKITSGGYKKQFPDMLDVPEMIEVESLPRGAYQVINPIDEMRAQFEGDIHVVVR